MYEWINQLDKKPESLKEWNSRFGPIILKRGSVFKVKFQVYNPEEKEIYIVGDFSNWKLKEEYKLLTKEKFSTITLNVLHGEKYKFFMEGDFFQDPAGHYFDDEGNSVFWGFENESAKFLDLRKKSVRVLQTDLPGLIVHYNSDGVFGSEIAKKNYYKFVKDSGVIKEIKSLGFNAIQFLPFAQSIDGDNWKYRYLVPFQYAIQKNWGTPKDFREMIEAFHKEGIAVIGDFVLGHLPHKDFKIFGLDSDKNGIHTWKTNIGYVYLKDETSWGTMRVNFDDPIVREFFISSVLHFMKFYGIDGFRIDNVDGILRYGANGDEAERPNGRSFLRELNKAIYKHNPAAMIHYEAHYFHEDNAKLLVQSMDENDRALGATAYNSSRLTYYFHKDYMLKAGSHINTWRFKHITEEKEWGESNSTIADFHNHDAAAGLMPQRATGSYAYDAMTQDLNNHIHGLGKIKVMEAIISFFCEGRTLDLLQTFLLQRGTFEHDSSVHWQNLAMPASKNLVGYKKRVNLIMENAAFWPVNVKNREFLNVDDNNKILVIERKEKKRFVIIINLTSKNHFNYSVGLKTKKDYEVILNSDEYKYSGLGIGHLPNTLKNIESKNFEVLEREVVIPCLAPYQVIVLREKN